MEKQIPESWIGEDVLLARTGAPESELVVVKNVNETGLAYTYKNGDMKETPVFVPWGSVSWLRPSVSADLQEPEGDENGE